MRYGGNIMNNFTLVNPIAPSFCRAFGSNSLPAAGIEAFSAAMPLDRIVNSPVNCEQGVIELDNLTYTLERTLTIDLSGQTTKSRSGLTIRGQGVDSTKIYAPATSLPANFKGVDNIWRMISIVSGSVASPGGVIQNIRIENLSIICYFTQDGLNVNRLTDDAIVVDFQAINNVELRNVRIYVRNFGGTENQYLLKLKQCFYSSLNNMQFVSFRQTSSTPTITAPTGLKPDGTVTPKLYATAMRIEECNGVEIHAPNMTNLHRGIHFYFDEGTHVTGGNIEHFNQFIFCDAGTGNLRVDGTRLEYHANGGNPIPDNLEVNSLMWVARFSETAYNNQVRVNTPVSSYFKLADDRSQSGSNIVETAVAPISRVVKNLLKDLTWSNSSGVSVATSTDVPFTGEFSTSTEITSPGLYNRARVATLPIDPRMGQVTFRTHVKRVSGDGMLIWQLRSSTSTTFYPNGGKGMVDTVFGRWSTPLTIPIAASGASWDGALLTLVFTVPHLLQPGMKSVFNGTGSGVWTAGTIDLYVRTVVDDYTVIFAPYNVASTYAVSPGTITGGNITVDSDSVKYRGFRDCTTGNEGSGWQEIIVSVPVKGRVIAINVVANKPVLTFDGNNYLGTQAVGSIIKLWGFKDTRFNTDYVLQSGDVVGNNLTISGATVNGTSDWTTGVGLPPIQSAVSSSNNNGVDTATPCFGWGGSTSLTVGINTVTTSGQTLVWRYTNPILMQGNFLRAGVLIPDPLPYVPSNTALPYTNPYIPLTTVKSSTQQINSGNTGTTLADIGLSSAIAANEVWLYEWELDVGAGLSSTGIKISVQQPAGGTVTILASAICAVVTTAEVPYKRSNTVNGTIDFSTTDLGTVTDAVFRVKAYVTNSTTAGTVSLQVAQSTSSGTDLNVRLGGTTLRTQRLA